VIEIVEYVNKYEKAAKQLMVDISVNEYGFKEYEQGFMQSDYDKFQKSGGNFWIALDENKNVIGTMAMEKKENVGYLSGVYLQEKYRGMGIAQKLLEMAIEYSKKSNIEKIILDTHERFSRAIKFYEKNNFIRINENDKEYSYILDLRKEN